MKIEKRSDIGKGKSGDVEFWLREIDLAGDREKSWVEEAKKTESRYAYEGHGEGKNHNILWSNTETRLSLLYGASPRPDVRRRYRDKDPIGLGAAKILERSLAFSIDSYDFDSAILSAVMDYLLPGRAVTRVGYFPAFRTTEVDGETIEELVYEEVQCEPVSWVDYRHSAGKTWKDVWWDGYRHFLTRDELVEKFGPIGKQVELDAAVEGSPEDEEKKHDQFMRATVWEIWDKRKRQVVFIAKSYDKAPLLVLDDPLKLSGFWPHPEPLRAVKRNNSLIPIPEYRLYKDQAEELDQLTGRISRVVESIKVRGIYDSTCEEIAGLLRAGDNELVPATNPAMMAEKGGVEKAIWFFPVEKLAQVLVTLLQERNTIKNEIYEITGLSDIMRGLSNPHETLGAQQIKSNWGGTRLKRHQTAVANYVRDLLRIKAEIIAEHFSPEMLSMMTGVQVLPEMVQVLRDDGQRSFRVDIETDSTIAGLQQEEQSNMTELLKGVAEFFESIGPAVQSGYLPIQAAKSMLTSAIRRFRMGHEVEEAMEMIGQNLPTAEQVQQMQQQLQEKDMQLQQMAQQIQAIQQEYNEHAQEMAVKDRESAGRIDAEKYKADLASATKLATEIIKAEQSESVRRNPQTPH